MDLHKILYKERSQIVSSRQHSKINRQMQESHRNQQRKDRFQNSRNISLSPKPLKTDVASQVCLKDKENTVDVTNIDNPDTSREVKLICNTTNPQKLSRQEEFVKRYINWKDNKKEMKQQEASNKRKPFVSAVKCGRQTITSCSIVPRGHHKEFRPPAGLKNPLDKEKIEKNLNSVPKSRQSLYTIVPTPPRKTKPTDDKKINKFPIARKASATNLHKQILYANHFENKSSTAPATLKNVSKDNKNPTTSSSNLNKDKLSTSKSLTQKQKTKLTANNLVTAFENAKSTVSILPAIKAIERTKLKPKALNMPPPTLPPSRSTVRKLQITNKKTEEQPTLKRDGAPGKISNMPSKCVKTKKPARKSPLKSGGARLAQSLKAKKPLKDSMKLNIPSIQVNGKKLLNLVTNFQPVAEMIIQTPKDFAHQNPFEEFVTSTKLRNSSQVTEDFEPFSKRSHGNSSAKRILLDDIIPIPDVQEIDKQEKTNSNNLEVLEKIEKKFNFIRYSEANVSYEEDLQNDCDDHNNKKEHESAGKIENNASLLEGDKTLIQTTLLKKEKTPTKSGPEERPANYLSPFVTVTRGKVSLKKEKEKRNSVYLQNTLENEDSVKENLVSDSPEYFVEVRRTLEAVRYFRKQLEDEIARLNQLCEVWELYKDENLEKIENANGEDMINVTIGQTRLLSSKKFMQFKGLIDRCESGATGINAVPYDGSEATRPITAVDLEGFWSMLGIQVDNLDKRFENLNRWKSNNWQDPDEVKTKTKKNLTKVKKAKATITTKAKPSSALQQMLRNMRKIKNKNDDENTDVISTPSKLKQAMLSTNKTILRKSVDKINSPGRLSIVVKDRKYFSPAATVLSISSPIRRSSILHRKSSQDSPKIIKYIQTFNQVLDNIQSSNDLRKSTLINGCMNSRRMSLNSQSPLVSKNNRKISLDSPRNRKNSNYSEDLRKSTLLVENGCNLPETPQSPLSSPALNGRKSILKTPGTAKSRLKSVLFNEKLRVKKFNFMVTEGDADSVNADDRDEANNTHEEDLAKSVEDLTQTEEGPRTLFLRNRKVRLRPSCEIVIPKAK